MASWKNKIFHGFQVKIHIVNLIFQKNDIIVINVLNLKSFFTTFQYFSIFWRFQNWIFPPDKISIYVSYNGIDFIQKSNETIAVLERITDASLETLHIEVNDQVKAIKISVDNVQKLPEWHDGAGSGAWLFMDEIIFNK